MAISTNKLLGKSEKGGELMVRPTTSLVGSTGSEKSEDVVYDIQTKLIKVDKLLKGTFAAKKSQYKVEKKQKEDEKRAQQEADQEKPDKDGEEESPKSLIPKLSFLDGIKKFLGGVLMGWLTFRLIKFLPQIVSFLKPAAAFVDFLINFGGKLLDGLVTFVDKGYEVFEKTEEWIGDVFGEDSAAKFKNFAETFTKFLNVALIAAMIGAKGGMFGMGATKGVRRGAINTGKRIIKRAGRLFDPQRAKKLARLKNIKKIRADKLLRVKKFGRLRKFAKAKKLVGKGINLGKNIVKSGADKIDDIAKTGKNWFGKLKGAGKNIWGKLGQAKDFLGKQGKSFINWADDFGKKFMAIADEIVKGVMAQGSKWATQIGDVAQMAANPGKLLEKAKGVLSGQLDDILKQNKTIAQLKNLNPKDAAKSIKGILNNAKKSKGLLQVRNALKGAQKMKIGGVDKVIAALMGLLDYTVFKESPINAILRALGGLLGYTAGFAIGAPFGGAPGFITGMAGGFVGEKAAMLVAKLLAKTPLAQIPDPIMNDGRMLVRDPDAQSIEEEEKKKPTTIKQEKTVSGRFDMKTGKGYINDQEVSMDEYEKFANMSMKEKVSKYGQVKGNAENILPLDVNSVSKKATSVSESASYEEGADETIIVKSGSEQDTTDTTEKESLVLAGVGGNEGASDEVGDLLYKGG